MGCGQSKRKQPKESEGEKPETLSKKDESSAENQKRDSSAPVLPLLSTSEDGILTSVSGYYSVVLVKNHVDEASKAQVLDSLKTIASVWINEPIEVSSNTAGFLLSSFDNEKENIAKLSEDPEFNDRIKYEFLLLCSPSPTLYSDLAAVVGPTDAAEWPKHAQTLRSRFGDLTDPANNCLVYSSSPEQTRGMMNKLLPQTGRLSMVFGIHTDCSICGAREGEEWTASTARALAAQMPVGVGLVNVPQLWAKTGLDTLQTLVATLKKPVGEDFAPGEPHTYPPWLRAEIVLNYLRNTFAATDLWIPVLLSFPSNTTELSLLQNITFSSEYSAASVHVLALTAAGAKNGPETVDNKLFAPEDWRRSHIVQNIRVESQEKLSAAVAAHLLRKLAHPPEEFFPHLPYPTSPREDEPVRPHTAMGSRAGADQDTAPAPHPKLEHSRTIDILMTATMQHAAESHSMTIK